MLDDGRTMPAERPGRLRVAEILPQAFPNRIDGSPVDTDDPVDVRPARCPPAEVIRTSIRAMPTATTESPSTKWPKPVPELTPEQVAIRDDFMKYFHEIYSDKFGAVAKFNHRYARRSAKAGIRTLEVGAGLGEHLEFEDARDQDYVALELRPEMAEVIAERYPHVSTVTGDVEQRLPFDDASFDRVVAIHVLEHLPNLPAALDEIHRILRPGGVVAVVIPCEGGLGYALGRRLTSQRIFEKRYDTSYDWYIKTEHFNVPSEITAELDRRFTRSHSHWFPLRAPSVHLNLCLGLTYARRTAG
jgi:SAM-dependent methyltransferase